MDVNERPSQFAVYGLEVESTALAGVAVMFDALLSCFGVPLVGVDSQQVLIKCCAHLARWNPARISSTRVRIHRRRYGRSALSRAKVEVTPAGPCI